MMSKAEWKMVRLEDVCDILDYKRKPVKEEERIHGQYPYYGANGIQGYINDYLFDDDLVLLAEDGGHFCSKEKPIAYKVMGKCWVNNHAHVLKPKNNKTNIDYLCYSLMFYDVSKLINGTTRAKLNQAAMRCMQICLRPLDEQIKIATTLDKANELIVLRKKQLEELDALAEAVFYDLFGDPVKNEKGWKVSNLKKVTIKIGSGATPRGGNENYKSEGINLIRSLNVHNGIFQYKDLAYIDENQAKLLNNVIVENGDVLLNITGASVARCCTVPEILIPARVNQHVSIIRTLKDQLNQTFLMSILTSTSYQHKLIRAAKSNGATREALTKQDIENLQIPLPPLPLQTRFASIIEKIEEQKAQVRKALQESEDLFQRLMQDLFKPD